MKTAFIHHGIFSLPEFNLIFVSFLNKRVYKLTKTDQLAYTVPSNEQMKKVEEKKRQE